MVHALLELLLKKLCVAVSAPCKLRMHVREDKTIKSSFFVCTMSANQTFASFVVIATIALSTLGSLSFFYQFHCNLHLQLLICYF